MILLDMLLNRLAQAQAEGTRRDTTDIQDHWYQAALRHCESPADTQRVERVRAGLHA